VALEDRSESAGPRQPGSLRVLNLTSTLDTVNRRRVPSPSPLNGERLWTGPFSDAGALLYNAIGTGVRWVF